MSMRNILILAPAAIFVALAAGSLAAANSQEHAVAWPQRVLITNDNGIHDGKVWALARAFAEHGDTWLVAANQDRSGTSNLVSLGRFKQAITVRRVFKGERLTAYAVEGYPADCVVFAVLGLLRDDPPDLVISGVNGGANLGVRSWFGSGTIGAARMAAMYGIPAIAVSGLDDDDPQMVTKVTQWVVKLSESPIVRGLKPGQYLTVAIPRVPADKIRGIRIVSRAPAPHDLFEFTQVQQIDEDGKPWEVWVGKPTGNKPEVTRGSDTALYRQGYIVITPMRIGEVDSAAIPLLQKRLDLLPSWTAGMCSQRSSEVLLQQFSKLQCMSRKGR